MSLRQFVDTAKSIATAPGWTVPEADGYVRIYAPLDIAGVTEAGLVLSVGAYVIAPDRHVTFELSVLGFNSRRRIRLSRIDWRSLTGGHSNRKCSIPALRNKPVPPTHIHDFDCNWVEADGRMRHGNLPCATAIDKDIQSFESLREHVGTVFNIKNIEVVPQPPWVYDLFA